MVANAPVLVAPDELDATLAGSEPILMIMWGDNPPRSDVDTALKQIAKEHGGKLRVIKVDASSAPELAERFSLRKHPLLIGWLGGEPKFRRSRPWGPDVSGMANDLLALHAEANPQDAAEEATGDDANGANGALADGKPVHVTDATFEEMVLKSPVPVLVDFWADWCGPCKMVAPILDKLAQEFAGQIRVAKVDVDTNQALAQGFQIMSIPTLMFVKNGKIVGQSAGAAPEPALRDAIRQLLALQV